MSLSTQASNAYNSAHQTVTPSHNEIPRILKIFEDRTALIQEQLLIFEGKLSPVLRPVPPEAPPSGCRAIAETELGEILNKHCDFLDCLSVKINEMEARLAL